jgi:hypothetical protein
MTVFILQIFPSFLTGNLLCRERFKIFMTVMILIMLFWVKSLCGLVGRSQEFGEVYCLHL